MKKRPNKTGNTKTGNSVALVEGTQIRAERLRKAMASADERYGAVFRRLAK